MVYMYHSFLIHLSADGHLGCFHVLAMINSAAINIGVHVSFRSDTSCLKPQRSERSFFCKWMHMFVLLCLVYFIQHILFHSLFMLYQVPEHHSVFWMNNLLLCIFTIFVYPLICWCIFGLPPSGIINNVVMNTDIQLSNSLFLIF